MTRQITESPFYNGQEYHLNVELLENYFREFPQLKPKENQRVETACWRGYVAHFEIRNGQLIIQNLDCLFDKAYDHCNQKLPGLFPEKKFTWFSGLIRIDDFRGWFDDDDNENGVYELLEIRDGNLIKHWKLDFLEFNAFKELLFSDFKNTEDYDGLFSRWRNKNPEMEPSEIDRYIFDQIVNNVRKF